MKLNRKAKIKEIKQKALESNLGKPRKSIPRTMVKKPSKTKNKNNTKKSIIGKLLPKKSQRSFCIYTIKNDSIAFIRLVSKQDDMLNVIYDVVLVKKSEDASKFISMETAKLKIEELKSTYHLNIDIKAIECEKLKK